MATRPCELAAAAALPMCNRSLPAALRAADLVARIPDVFKAGLLINGAAKATIDLGGGAVATLPAYQWWAEGHHGVCQSHSVNFTRGPVGWATVFPQVIGTASSLNVSLFAAIGAATSTEARALANAGQAGLTFWAPNINIFRDPRWGRGQETPGECPTVNGVYAAAFVRGMQEGEDNQTLKVSACCKHLEAYSLEDSDGWVRTDFDARITAADLRESYEPPFRACVAGGASCVMCSCAPAADRTTLRSPRPGVPLD